MDHQILRLLHQSSYGCQIHSQQAPPAGTVWSQSSASDRDTDVHVAPSSGHMGGEWAEKAT